MNNYFTYILFFVFLIIRFEATLGQQPRELKIVAGETYELTKSHKNFDKIIVKGLLKVVDKRNLQLVTGQMIIDGGTLEVGTPEEPFHHQFKLLFKNKGFEQHGLKVVNQGRVYLNGRARKNDSLQKTIQLTTFDSTQNAIVTFKDVNQIQISQTTFKGLGNKSNAAVAWEGASKESYIQHSAFVNSKNTDIELDNTSITLKQNLFITNHGSTIICSKSGLGTNNKILENTIYASGLDSIYAISIHHPFQHIQKNRLVLSGAVSGILFRPKNPKQKTSLQKSKSTPSFEENTLERVRHPLENQVTNETIGILFEDFGKSLIFKARNNSVSNFSVGAIVTGGNYVLEKCHFKNNTTGVFAGTGYLNECTFHMANKVKGTTAIIASNRFGNAAPKITDVNILNYDTGIQYDGVIGASNYIKATSFVNTVPVSFKNLSAESVILDADGSLSLKGNPNKDISKNSIDHAHHNISQAHHTMVKTDKTKRTLIYPKTALLVSEASQQFNSLDGVYCSDEGLSGVLAISTGFGLSDPVHEHDGNFIDLEVHHLTSGNSKKIQKQTNRQELLLSANSVYKVMYKNKGNPLYDISLEWDGPIGTWIMVQLPYPHEKPVAMRSFGSLIQPSKSINEVKNSPKTTYFVDRNKKMAFIKLFNSDFADELVLYSSRVKTEIEIEGQKIPIELVTHLGKNQLSISFKTPKNTFSQLDVLDYYGNIVNTLFKGTSIDNITKSTIDLNQYDIEKEMFRYSLTVDGKNHKGPIHTYNSN
ncbi:G8 domain-containing protein [Costertonia aggregata]|uniref:G8 domain-containing protein n=1 Tax=Costertonia aggregata TaxID=343403 RepID=A0A7H9AQN6_9FLAO|nr:G8 domain-containing protein [Costertonia aggregata]QLG45719.1 hypothetical protein HYG79_10290 [Costertonia aggregata]